MYSILYVLVHNVYNEYPVKGRFLYLGTEYSWQLSLVLYALSFVCTLTIPLPITVPSVLVSRTNLFCLCVRCSYTCPSPTNSFCNNLNLESLVFALYPKPPCACLTAGKELIDF